MPNTLTKEIRYTAVWGGALARMTGQDGVWLAIPTGHMTANLPAGTGSDPALAILCTLNADDTVATLGTTTYSETSTKGNVIGAVRNDVLAALAGTDGEIAPLQVNPDGALYTSAIIDTTAHANNAFNVASAVASASQSGIVPLVKMNEVVAAPSGHVDNDWTYLQTDLNGSLYTTHCVTGMVSDVNSDVDGSEAQQLDGSTSGLDVACKRVDLMATHDNTGYIWVGDSGVTANGGGGGMRLAPGDFYSIDVNNLNDIWVIATVDAENIHYIYFT